MNLTVAVPIYNEAGNIPELLKRLRKVCSEYQPYEIICVNDGSIDDSLKILIEQKDNFQELKIIDFEKNRGKSDALDACFKEAKGDLIVTFDADLQELPEEIPLLIRMLNGVDAVFGWRYKRTDTFAKRFASKFANSFRRIFLRDGAHDTGCPIKVFKRSILQKITLFHGMHRFFPVLILINGGTFREVKISHARRITGQSKYSTFDRAFPAFIDLLAVMWMKKRALKYKIKRIY